MGRAAYLCRDGMSHVLALLTPDNRLCMEIALHTGLRIGDVLALRREDIKPRMSVIERKTGKRRVISLTADLVRRARGDGSPGFVFPGARDPMKHRTRQAVWRDVVRAAKVLRYRRVSPHSARKTYAVDYFHAHGDDLAATRRVLNHDRDATTMIYALADLLAERERKKR